MSERQFYHVEVDLSAGPVGPARERPIVTSARLDEGPRHDRLTVWNRGGLAGTLTVDAGDGIALLDRLIPHRVRREVPGLHEVLTPPTYRGPS